MTPRWEPPTATPRGFLRWAPWIAAAIILALVIL